MGKLPRRSELAALEQDRDAISPASPPPPVLLCSCDPEIRVDSKRTPRHSHHSEKASPPRRDSHEKKAQRRRSHPTLLTPYIELIQHFPASVTESHGRPAVTEQIEEPNVSSVPSHIFTSP
ncbi:unnamed protein product [Boreogadus saida]